MVALRLKGGSCLVGSRDARGLAHSCVYGFTHLKHDKKQRHEPKGHNFKLELLPSMDQPFMLPLPDCVRDMFID